MTAQELLHHRFPWEVLPGVDRDSVPADIRDRLGLEADDDR